MANRILRLAKYIGAAILALAGLLRQISDLEHAPERLREISRMWIVQAALDPLVIIGMLVLLVGLAHTAYTDGWWAWIKQKVSGPGGHSSNTKLVSSYHFAEWANPSQAASFIAVSAASANAIKICVDCSARISGGLWTEPVRLQLGEFKGVVQGQQLTATFVSQMAGAPEAEYQWGAPATASRPIPLDGAYKGQIVILDDAGRKQCFRFALVPRRIDPRYVAAPFAVLDAAALDEIEQWFT